MWKKWKKLRRKNNKPRKVISFYSLSFNEISFIRIVSLNADGSLRTRDITGK